MKSLSSPFHATTALVAYAARMVLCCSKRTPKDVLEPMDIQPIVPYDEEAAKARAATAIQARARGVSSRKEHSTKEQEQLAQAATVIQASLRGHSSRKEQETMQKASVKLQASVRSLKAKRELGEAKVQQRTRSESAAAFEKECRERNAAMDQLLEQETAVKAVQAVARGKAVRFEKTQQVQAAVKVQSVLRRKNTTGQLEILRAARAAQAAGEGSQEDAAKEE